MANERLHVVPHEGGWAVRQENKANVESTHSTQRSAIDAARDQARPGQADIVVHRMDGTIRSVFSYLQHSDKDLYEDEGNGRGEAMQKNDSQLDQTDLVSVGTRISWGAIAAGAAVALTVFVILGALLAAAGMSMKDAISDRSLFVSGVICTMVIAIGAYFLGGFFASQLTAGETKCEAMTYGLIVWATMFMGLSVMALAGADVGTNALVLDRATVDQVRTETRAAASEINPQTVAWCTFGTFALSLAAAVGGAWIGAGPNLMFRRVRRDADAHLRGGTMRVGTTA